jgi:excisionase family DNA binding protein
MQIVRKKNKKPQAAEQRYEALPRIAFTLAEVSEAVKVSRRFLEGEINAGRLNALKFGTRCTRVRQEDINRWMEANATAK